MTGTKRDRIYLDSNVILDWVGRSQDPRARMGVGGLIAAVCANQFDAVVSDITRLEVLECKADPTMWRAWEAMRARRNVQVAGCTRAVMDRAVEIRNHYQALKEKDGKAKRAPSTPDCIHVATALIFDCKTMYSFDSGRKAGDVSPLDLGPTVIGKYPLTILPADQADVSGFNF